MMSKSFTKVFPIFILALLVATVAQATTYRGTDLRQMMDAGTMTVRGGTGVEGLTCTVVDNELHLRHTGKQYGTLLIRIAHDELVGRIVLDAHNDDEDSYTTLDEVTVDGQLVGSGEKDVSYDSGDDLNLRGTIQFAYNLCPNSDLVISSLTLGVPTREMRWDKDEMTATLGETPVMPVLHVKDMDDIDFTYSNLGYDVTWTSSNEQVVRMVQGCNRMVLMGVGEATVTIHMAESENYPAGSASLKVKVQPYQLDGSSEHIHLTEAGTLALALVDLESTKVGSIKITGKINSADLKTLNTQAGRLAHVQVVDLSDATLCYDDGVYVSWSRHSDVGLGSITYRYALSETERDHTESDWLGGANGNSTVTYYTPNLDFAFSGMTSLRKLVLPKMLGKIGRGLCDADEGLVEIEVPAGIDEVGASAFSGCSKLVKHNLGALRAVGASAFNDVACTNLDLSRIQQIGTAAFKGCLIKSVDLSAVDTIPSEAFRDCQALDRVTFGPGLRVIGSLAFSNTALTSVDLPEGLTDIGFNAFRATQLTEVKAPSTLRHVGASVFYETPWEAAQYGKGVDGVIYWGGIAMCKDPAYTVPDHAVLKIREGTTALSESFDYAGSEKVVEMQLPSTLKYTGAGSSFGNLETVNLPDGLEEIGTLFASSRINVLAIPESVTTIASLAFFGCKSLVRVTYRCRRAEGTSIFSGCEGLDKVIIGAHVERLPDSMFRNCKSLMKVEFEDRDYAGSLKKMRAAAEHVADAPFEVGDQTFLNCSNLASVNLPMSTVSLGEEAFCGCNALKTFVLTPHLKTIGNGSLPSSLTTIYNYMPEPYDFSSTSDIFAGGSNTTVYVLPEYFDAYCANAAWRQINIAEMDEDYVSLGIVGVRTARLSATLYNLQGVAVKNPRPGVYVCNGKKVIVR